MAGEIYLNSSEDTNITTENSKMSFENFLLKRTLDELLNLISKEKDPIKYKQIKKVLNLKTNYYDDSNQKLKGFALYKHKQNILRKYKNTEFEKYINIKKSKFNKKILIYILLLLIPLGIYSQKNKIIKYYYDSKEYEYNDVTFKHEDFNRLLSIKMNLGKIYLKKQEMFKAYKTYLDAYGIYVQLNKPIKAKEVENKLVALKRKIYIILENRLIKAKNTSNPQKQMEELNDIYNIAKEVGLYETQGKILELKGDLLFKKNKKEYLGEIKNYYLLAYKVYEKSKNHTLIKIEKKIENIDKLIVIEKLINEEKILQLQNETVKAKLKYDEIKKISKELSGEYQIFNLRKD